MRCTRAALLGAQNRGACVLDVAQPAERERDVELLLDQLERERNALLAERPQAVGVGAADHGRARAERARAPHVLAAADAAVEPRFSFPLNSTCYLREGTDRRDRAVELAPAVVRHHDRIRARLHRELGVLGIEDALDDELAAPELLHPLDVFP